MCSVFNCENISNYKRILKSLAVIIITILINLFTKFRILTSNIDGQVTNPDKLKFVAKSRNRYFGIVEFINLDKHIKENTYVHLEYPTQLTMIVVREFKNNKQSFQMKLEGILLINSISDRNYRFHIITSINW